MNTDTDKSQAEYLEQASYLDLVVVQMPDGEIMEWCERLVDHRHELAKRELSHEIGERSAWS